MILTQDKVFFNPGDLVKVKHNIDNVPIMYVVEKISRTLINKENTDKEKIFIGIKCRWFDNNLVLQEAIFSTKDLIHVVDNI